MARKYNIAVVFPGQGSQAVGGGRLFFEKSPRARALAMRANELAEFDLLKLMFDGPLEQLSATQYAQPALFTVNAMAWAFLCECLEEWGEDCVHEEIPGSGNCACGVGGEDCVHVEIPRGCVHEGLGGGNCACGEIPSSAKNCARKNFCINVVAGHSLGEYNAMLAAECADFDTLFRLIQLRATAMMEASPKDGVMCAILGVDIDQATEIIREDLDSGECAIANDNCPGQIVLSGVRDGVDAACDKLMRVARKKVMLSVSGPFHSQWMAAAAEKLAKAVAQITFAAPKIPIISNASASVVRTAQEVAALPATQITSRVRWRESVVAAENMGTDVWVEAGCGKVLSGLVKRSLTGTAAQAEIFQVQEFVERYGGGELMSSVSV